MNAMRTSVVGRAGRPPRRGDGRPAGVGLAGLAGLALLACLLHGCGDDAPAPGGGAARTPGGTADGGASAPRRERIPVDPASAGRIVGVVRVQGDVPEPETFVPSVSECVKHSGGRLTDRSLLARDGRLQDAFVWIPSGLDGYIFPEAQGAVAIDQKGCLFTQRVLGVRVGQDIELRNSDPVLHNVNFKGRANKAANYAIPAGGEPRTTSLRKPELVVPVVCDVHPWMYASVAVVDHPCVAVTDASGAVEIAGVPPGTYTQQAWHEKLGNREVQVTVGRSSTATAPDLVFTMP
jgi:plastocyanin